MEGHLAGRIILARGGESEIDGNVEPGQIDPEMRKQVLEPDHQHAMRPVPHRLSRQKRKRIDHVDCHETLRLESVFVEGTADRVGQILRLRRLRRKIAGRFLGGDFDMSIGRNQLVGKRNPLGDINPLPDQSVVLHVAHGHETIDPFQPQPMDDIRHQLLETGILNASDTFSPLKV